jgi:hypothetical protein
MLLAAGGGPPRARARDQQADLAGEALRREILNRLVTLDPATEDMEQALLSIAGDLGQPSGPARAVGLSIRQEWEMARANPEYWSFLVREALQGEDRRPPRAFRFPEREAAQGGPSP